MNLAGIDLNLLVALDALLMERHVGRAARRIGLSQPAASHALRRLRGLLDDPLLVRVGARMELTPRATSLRQPLADALRQVRSVLAVEPFEPARSRRRFAMMMHDHVAHRLVPMLVHRIHTAAPHVRLDVLPWQSATSLTASRLGTIDVLISCTAHQLAGFERETLCTDTEVVVVRDAHPARRGMSTLDGFLAASHVAVVGRGLQDDPVDVWLRQHNLVRRVALRVPSYLQALQVVARTDLVAFVPAGLARSMEGPLSLGLSTPPIDPGNYDEYLFYPRRTLADPASLWLRGVTRDVRADLEGHQRSTSLT